MNDVVIRAVNKEDIPQLLELMIEYIVDFYQKPKPAEESLNGLIEHLLDYPSSGMQFCAEKNGKLLGFATLYFTFSTLQVKRAAILNDLYVSSEARGQKLGEKLFQACLGFIRENHFAYMTWETAKDNIVAQSLYKKMGGHQSQWVTYEIS
ncbi:GNAT family N-acetyltransferase [Paenibacillus sp. HJGM_3]|uniref:GNAT family N-acetyltransferase n=1 Tax=Paenibacillus sp. HJGM_3 TaxID=3379816 RepID=UPI00385973AD